MEAMTFKIVAPLILAAWAAGLVHTTRAEQAAPVGGSTWGGVYSDEQATRGAAAYAKHCTECHLEDLAGDGFAPALKGPEFLNNWNGLTVGDLFERIRVSMPPSDPNAVPVTDKADIVAHILKSSGFPAGKTELAPQTEALKAFKFEATKPGR
jgi:hypothetical protein